jgi:CHAT domain-containing protein
LGKKDPLARVTWCLCLILTLLIAGSKRPVVARTVDSDPWWGTKEAREIRSAAEQFRAAKNFAAAEAVDLEGFDLARLHHNDSAAFVYLTAIGAARLLQFQYRPALEAFLQARELAEKIGDPAAQGIIAVNLSSLYLQTWDLDLAIAAAELGIARIETSPRAYCKLPLLLQLGKLHQMLADDRAPRYFVQAIEEARQQGDVAQEARAWDLLGEERLRSGQAALAEKSIVEAFRLRLMADRADLGFSYARLGAAKLAVADFAAAASFTDQALTLNRQGQNGLPRYLLLQQRGEVRRMRGEIAVALRDFNAAIEEAGLWREGLLPAQGPLVAANAELEKRIFRSFIETAAATALRTGLRTGLHNGAARLAAESFAATELNRAASLRETQSLAHIWRAKLPAEYWKTLAELRERESRNEPDAGRLRLSLAQMEGKAGLEFSTNKYENFRGPASLIHFQHSLSPSELFLSIHLGDGESYLWVVTRNSLSLHRLPPAEEIRSTVVEFRDAIRRGATPVVGPSDGVVPQNGAENRDQVEGLGRRLYAEWFGSLTRDELDKPEWLLSLDGPMFQMPFGALVAGMKDGKMKYLVEQHSLRIVPGALSLMESLTGASRVSRGATDVSGSPSTRGSFLGVGDPIYNTADPRWAAIQRHRFSGWFAFGGSADGGNTSKIAQWSRLVGSAREVEVSAQNWTGETAILEGTTARRARFLELAARKPAVIHLATHIFTPRAGTGDALIAFGLSPTGRSESLSTSEVGMLNVPGAVVSMTGCDSGAGEAKAGAGLLGLTRAWQMAGARAVIASAWPVNDTRGELFAAFYRHLGSASPAEALRLSQIEMIQSGTWRAAPAYWASFQVTGGGH